MKVLLLFFSVFLAQSECVYLPGSLQNIVMPETAAAFSRLPEVSGLPVLPRISSFLDFVCPYLSGDFRTSLCHYGTYPRVFNTDPVFPVAPFLRSYPSILSYVPYIVHFPWSGLFHVIYSVFGRIFTFIPWISTLFHVLCGW